MHRFRGYSDPCLLPHAVLLLEQELGSTVQYGASGMGAVLSTVASNPCFVLSHVPSATLLYCAHVWLTSREWLDA